MEHPLRFRIDGDQGRALSSEEMRPYVRKAMGIYQGMPRPTECGSLLTPEEATEVSLADHNVVLIQGDYLLAYSLGHHWWSRSLVLEEEYLIRIGRGYTTLKAVFSTMRSIRDGHGAREFYVATFAPSNQTAIRRLYLRAGATEVAATMRLR